MYTNLNTYNSRQIVNWYAELKEMTAVETNVFEQFKALIANGSVLDIGIGGGRTTAYLLARCYTYIGIDYSENFVKNVKSRYPGIDCRHMDARNLSAFSDKSFDFVNFSFNGIDYVDLVGREKALSEIWRVLKPGGIFFFSTHNKDHATFNKHPWLLRNNGFSVNLKTFLKLLPFIPRKLKNKTFEIIANDYAIINDSAHNYSLFTFYTSINFLREQLKNSNFTNPTLYTKKGNATLLESELEDWVFVTVQKP